MYQYYDRSVTITVSNLTPTAPTVGTITQPTCAVQTGSVVLSGLPGAAWTITQSPGGATYTGATSSYTVTGLAPNTTYTFTVTINSTGCKSSSSNPVVINAVPGVPAAPTAGSNSPVCIGSTLNLSATTVAGATYNWTGPNSFSSSSQNPSIAGVTAAAAGTYSVTVTVSGCTSAPGTTTVVVNPNITPTFTPVAAICSGATLIALPTTSNNGITGTWAPALNNTTTTTYTFTPAAGQCATTTTLTITVNATVTPTFTAIPDVCQNAAAPTLPATSNNGITGTWAPAVSTATPGTTTYTFTPAAGQCATTTTLTITVNATVTPTFTAVPDICQDAAATSITDYFQQWHHRYLGSCFKYSYYGQLLIHLHRLQVSVLLRRH